VFCVEGYTLALNLTFFALPVLIYWMLAVPVEIVVDPVRNVDTVLQLYDLVGSSEKVCMIPPHHSKIMSSI
jgi:hypothetical protein